MAMYRHILVPTDGSKLSGEAAAEAVKLASLLGARLTALHVAPEIPPIELEGWARRDERFIEHLEKTFEKRSRAYLARVKDLADEAGVRCEVHYLHAASPASEIVIVATERGCDLIVMGSHGMGADADPLLGSVTAKVLARGSVPVLVHRARRPQRAAK
jgi:nucleotide-binding universal stress UspA family protein